MIANSSRFAIIKIVVRKSKRSIIAFFSYFIDWRINRADFRRVIQRFDRSIVKFQTYLNDRITPNFSSSRFSSFFSITSESKSKSTSKSTSKSKSIEKFKSITTIEKKISSFSQSITVIFVVFNQNVYSNRSFIEFINKSNNMPSIAWKEFDIIENQYNVFQIIMIAAMIVNRRSSSFSQQQKRQIIIIFDFRWNVQNVNFFDSYYENKTIFIDDSISHFDKNTFFKNVHLFVNRVKNIVAVKNLKLIRKNFWTCLRDRALKWWQSILIDEQKKLVKFDDNVDEWITALKKRFKKSSSNALNIIITFKYTFENARRRRDSINYVLAFFKTIKTIDVSIYNQLYFIYNELKSKFRHDLTRFTFDIIIN